jgi:chromosome segregation protein
LVHFAKLRLIGFKSFVDSTELAIEPGLTGIVGPNGCGKSNLVEALRWVMGETSPKRMRGDEMEDVIFAGNVTRPARNIAEVALTLDNSAKRAPAQFNEEDQLEVSRRIERGNGSLYRINGREQRARDVQLLFADSATGAHSTALVSQGRVSAIIGAKPTERRSLLEEAAGIAGLHSRRHEAELRLRAAEANLARLDDVILTLEGQYQSLRKQARQATRYRNINEQMRRSEALLFHLQWVELQARVEAAAIALATIEAEVATLTQRAAVAATEQADAAATLHPLRQAEAEAAAELQRVTLARDAIEQEEARLKQATAEARQRLAQIGADVERERGHVSEAENAAARLNEEQSTIEGAQAGEAAALEAAGWALIRAQAAVAESEHELGTLTERIATGEAERTALARRIEEIIARLGRLRQREAGLADERVRLETAAANDDSLANARAAVDETESRLGALQAESAQAEAARTEAVGAEAAARQRLDEAQAAFSRIAAEVDALSAIFATTASELWPPLIDSITVAAGYEAALGAALGDDLSASTDAGAPIHWQPLALADGPPVLPPGVEPLNAYVQAPPLLARRLSQVGVVADAAEGATLAPSLRQGQRLVTRDGALWRWDGYTVAAGAPAASATRLLQRNRLQALQPERDKAAAALGEAQEEHGRAHAAAVGASESERGLRQQVQQAFAAAAQARNALDEATRRVSAASSRLAAVVESLGEITSAATEADATLLAARAEHAALPDLDGERARAAAVRQELADRRAQLMDGRSAEDYLRREAEGRRKRVEAIAAERQSWQERARGAERQLQALGERQATAQAELSALEERPQALQEQRLQVMALIDAAATKRRAAADRLAEAETRLADADRALKAAEAQLHETRENRIRAESEVAQARQSVEALAERTRDHLGCGPEEALPLAELDPSTEMPRRDEIEAKLQRLAREREAIGPVNLRAEAEAAEVDEQVKGMRAEREDLVAAIARLRQGIASLNREGRERLLAAFELVNKHFADLFTRLFGGGHAHLKLTEAEDPLEAGLEIMASPPGKRLQVLSLLSGGEQALTAIALLFAVFLTHPAPICVLDEVDAPLDDANVDRFCSLVEELARSTETRFLVITHHRMTMARMDRLFGVTMAERGVSQLVSVDLQKAAELRAAE